MHSIYGDKSTQKSRNSQTFLTILNKEPPFCPPVHSFKQDYFWSYNANIIPSVGTFYSQSGNVLFPYWE